MLYVKHRRSIQHLLFTVLNDHDSSSSFLLKSLDDLSSLANDPGHKIAGNHHLVDLNGRLDQLTSWLQILVADDSLDTNISRYLNMSG